MSENITAELTSIEIENIIIILFLTTESQTRLIISSVVMR